MNFPSRSSFLQALVILFLLPVTAFALTSRFEDSYNAAKNVCVSDSSQACNTIVLNTLSTVRNATSGAQYDHEISTFAAIIASAAEGTTANAVCQNLAAALNQIALSAADPDLAARIADLATVVAACEGIGIDPDLLLASPN